MDNYDNELYKTLDEDINEELNNQATRPIYIIVKEAITTYEELMKTENHIFSGEYFEEIKGRLIGYTIKRAFDSKLITGNFPFDVNCARMNFNQRRPELRKNNILLTISQVNDSEKLPTKSKYKEEYSKGNSLLAKQLIFKQTEDLKIKNIPYYGIIRYKYAENELKLLEIVIPDSNYKSIIKRIPISIISEVKKIEEENQDNLEGLKSLLEKESLKEQIEKDIKDKKIQ